MNLRDLLLRRGTAGPDVGDYAPGDGWLDAAFGVDESLDGIHGLVGTLTRPDGMIVAGRIQWHKVLDGMLAPSKLVFEKGCETRGAPVMSTTPAACTQHHTGGRPTAKKPSPSLAICINGRPAGKGTTAVPGPLIHALNDYNGQLHICASGRANHAGAGHVEVMARMRAGLLPLGTALALGYADTGGFGGNLIGVEHENDGVSPLTWAQVDTAARLGRALTQRLGMSRAQAVGWDHQAQTRRKVDLPEAQHARILAAYDAWKPLGL